MFRTLLDLLLQSIWETIERVSVSALISIAVELPLALVLVATDDGGIWPHRPINLLLGGVVNALRSIPFIILLVALIPLTRLIVGTSTGTAAAIVPLAIASTPYLGAGGLGDLAIRYGYQRCESNVMLAVVTVLIVLVCGVQWGGDRLARTLDRRA